MYSNDNNNNKNSKKIISFEDSTNNDMHQTITSNNQFRDFNKELISIYRLHSSKFHSRQIENSKNISDKFNEQMNSLLIKENKSNEKINLWNEPFFIKFQNNYKNVFEFRKQMAFRFRYMNYSPKKISLMKNFKLKDDKMNKILRISKSIPNILFKEPKTTKNENKNIHSSGFENNFEDNFYENSLYKDNYKDKEYGFASSFKLNRYIGNLYNYYRSNHTLNDNNLIFHERSKKNKISIHNYDERINNISNEEKNIFSAIRNKNNKRIIFNNKNNVSINNNSKIVKLNSLL